MENKEQRQRGTVISFLRRKGYGFIRNDSNEKIFVHYSNIRGQGYKTLSIGEEVEFVLRATTLGYQAMDVVRVNPPAEIDKSADVKNKTW